MRNVKTREMDRLTPNPGLRLRRCLCTRKNKRDGYFELFTLLELIFWVSSKNIEERDDF